MAARRRPARIGPSSRWMFVIRAGVPLGGSADQGGWRRAVAVADMGPYPSPRWNVRWSRGPGKPALDAGPGGARHGHGDERRARLRVGGGQPREIAAHGNGVGHRPRLAACAPVPVQPVRRPIRPGGAVGRRHSPRPVPPAHDPCDIRLRQDGLSCRESPALSPVITQGAGEPMGRLNGAARRPLIRSDSPPPRPSSPWTVHAGHRPARRCRRPSPRPA